MTSSCLEGSPGDFTCHHLGINCSNATLLLHMSYCRRIVKYQLLVSTPYTLKQLLRYPVEELVPFFLWFIWLIYMACGLVLLTTEEDIRWRLNIGHGLFSPVSQPVSALLIHAPSQSCSFLITAYGYTPVSMLSRRPRYRSD